MELHQCLRLNTNVDFYTQNYVSKRKTDMNVDIDPKTMYTYKAYSHNLQNTIANMAELPELTRSFSKKSKPNPKLEEFLEGWRK